MLGNEGSVATLEKALKILDAIARERCMGVRELARSLEMSPASVSRILGTLLKYRMVEKDRRTGKFRLGMHILELSSCLLRNLELKERAWPIMEWVAQETGETVNLMVLDETTGEGIYVAVIESANDFRMAPYVGKREVLHCTGVGKAILAFLPEETAKDIIKKVGLPRFTSNTIVTPAELWVHLEQVRRQGYAIDNAESMEGIFCIGAPIFDHEGRVAAGISISSPAVRVDEATVEIFSKLIREAAARISQAIGYGTYVSTLDSSEQHLNDNYSGS